jgi:hypothetical protein
MSAKTDYSKLGRVGLGIRRVSVTPENGNEVQPVLIALGVENRRASVARSVGSFPKRSVGSFPKCSDAARRRVLGTGALVLLSHKHDIKQFRQTCREVGLTVSDRYAASEDLHAEKASGHLPANMSYGELLAWLRQWRR